MFFKIIGLSKNLIVIFSSVILLFSCGEKSTQKYGSEEISTLDPLNDKGIGPIKNVKLKELDMTMVEKGKKIFESKCVTCHTVSKNLIGPPLENVTERRNPVWIMNMMLNPHEMLEKNAIAKQLLKEYNNLQMVNQRLTEDEARQILEYLRTI